MSAMRAKAIVLIGIAAVGIVLFSLANFTAGSRGAGGLDPTAPPASGWDLKQDLVQLPMPTGAATLGEPPKPTGAPPAGLSGLPERMKADSGGEVVPVEDPYNG